MKRIAIPRVKEAQRAGPPMQEQRSSLWFRKAAPDKEPKLNKR
jgi:hypothetical protein